MAANTVFTRLNELPYLCLEEPTLDCDCDECWQYRRAVITAKCREIESRLNQDAIDEQTQRDNDGWSVLFMRARLQTASNTNDAAAAKETWRPPAMRSAHGS